MKTRILEIKTKNGDSKFLVQIRKLFKWVKCHDGYFNTLNQAQDWVKEDDDFKIVGVQIHQVKD